ncbi:hypothetical protein GQ457_18G006130 [Hibiscus cannabinus]
MALEAVRFRAIQQQIAALAPIVPGPSDTDSKLYPDDSMLKHQNKWSKLSIAVQSAQPDGTFESSVTVSGFTYRNVADVLPNMGVAKKTTKDEVIKDKKTEKKGKKNNKPVKETCNKRFAWVEVVGIPVNCQNYITFKRIAELWGEFV